MTKEQILYESNRSYLAIKKVQPEIISYPLLTFQLGERWVKLHHYNEFANWLFNTDSNNRATVLYLQGSDKFKVEIRYKWGNSAIVKDYYVSSTKGKTQLYGTDLLEHALENTNPIITYKVGDDTKLDTDAIQLANEKIDQIRGKFKQWLDEGPAETRDELVKLYNSLYNCSVLREYDGTHLSLPGINMEGLREKYNIQEVRDAQKAGVWRILSDCGALLDWEVGAGKSLTTVIAAHEMKRMKIRNKPCIVVLKSTLQDIVNLYRTAYPHDKLLAPTEKDFEKTNRVRLFHEMKNNDWDCIIMTHDQFGMIPQSPVIQEEIFQEELDNLEEDLKAITISSGISKSMKKGLETRKQSLNVKLKELRDQIRNRQDEDINFEEIGIDHILLDESHKFKNLSYTTRHERVAGLGPQQGSQKAMNLLFAIRTLQNRFDSDLQCTFLSGTPISNSLTEMYLIFKYLRPRALKKQGIYNFDSWASVFAIKTTDFEFSVTNQINAKERFRYFIKVPELAMFYNEIADYRTNASIAIDRPEMVEQLIDIEPTEDQVEFTENLIQYASTGNGHCIGRDDLRAGLPTDSARMLIATNYAKKMSTDMRLIDQDKYTDDINNKVSVACEKIVEFYRKFSFCKGVQLVFCDHGVPTKDKHEVVNPFTGESTIEDKFTVYRALKDKLVNEYLVPADEIQFIHDYTEKTRSKLFKRINDGEVRILLGSTDKAGTGVNVQQRVVAIHDLDIPWKPAELEQRGGRGQRQGNWVAKEHQDNKVYRFIYAVKKSLDTYKFTLLKNKKLFIDQMKKNELQVRTIDEGSFDEASGMNFAEYVAVLSGDNSLLEKAKIDKKLAILENLRSVHYRTQNHNRCVLESRQEEIVIADQKVEELQRDKDQYDKLLRRDDGGNRVNDIHIPALQEQLNQLQGQYHRWELDKQERKLLRSLKMGIPGQEEKVKAPKEPAEVIGEYIVKVFNEWRPQQGTYTEVLGTLYGFNCCIERCTNQNNDDGMTRVANATTSIMYFNRLYVQHPEGTMRYYHLHGVPSRDNMKLASRQFLNSLDRCGSLLNEWGTKQATIKQDIANLMNMKNEPFSKENELNQLREKSKELQKEISQKIQSNKTVTKEEPVAA